MAKKYLFLTLFIIPLIFISINGAAQVIDNSSTFKTLPASCYFRFQYDNDYFTKADRYYSQGISFEYVNPALKKFPFSYLLIKPGNTEMVFGLGLNIFGYTPTSILSTGILYNDRPYAAVISLKTFALATDTSRHRRISSAFSVGVIGPAALGKEIQTNIHRWLKNPLPQGWGTQIQNDVVLNYQINYEKQLLSAQGNFLLNAAGEFRAGTLDDKLSAGFNLMAGNFNDPYASKTIKKKRIAYYFYAQSRLHSIAYDASLQGGLLNRHDPYTISAAGIERIVFQADAGIVLNFRKLYLSYSQSYLGKEFHTGKEHRWGGINIGFAL